MIVGGIGHAATLSHEQFVQVPLHDVTNLEFVFSPVMIEVAGRLELAPALAERLEVLYRTDVLASRRRALPASDLLRLLHDQLEITHAPRTLFDKCINTQDAEMCDVLVERPESTGPPQLRVPEISIAGI